MVQIKGSDMILTACVVQVKKGSKLGVRLFGYEDTGAGEMAVNRLRSASVSEKLELMGILGVKGVSFDYYGLDTGFDLPIFNASDIKIPCMPNRTLRDIRKVYPLLKYYFPAYDINPIHIADGIAYDNPFIVVNGKAVCLWKPSVGFEDGEFSFDQGFLTYIKSKECYILKCGSKRHTPVKLEEALVMNYETGVITCRLRMVFGKKYIDSFHVWDVQSFKWKQTEYHVTPIDGYKYYIGIR